MRNIKLCLYLPCNNKLIMTNIPKTIKDISGNEVPMVRLHYVSGTAGKTGEAIRASDTAYQIFKQCYDENTIEHTESMYAMFLNRANKVLAVTLISVGGGSGCIFDQTVVCQTALLLNAYGIILCHNHPSGSLRPSDADNDITNMFYAHAKLLRLSLLDHIIITKDGYYSFGDSGTLIIAGETR